jgi:predicted AlkP superfamily pyrophosphatase or phosphodiesterase
MRRHGSADRSCISIVRAFHSRHGTARPRAWLAAIHALHHIRPMMRLTLAMPAALALACLAGSARPQPTQAPTVAPSLVVLITIDQFRADYLDRYSGQLTGGLARLARRGARFNNAHQDHAITETAPGHATLLSGRFPRSTGIMLNRVGVEDQRYPLVASGYGTGASPARFVGTTLADWMKRAHSQTKTLSVSMKDRGAILPIGTSKSDVYWYSIDGRFLTSTYYRKEVPAWVREFNDRQSVQAYAGRTWSLLLADSAYREPDSVSAEMGGRNFTFPHRLTDDPVDVGSEIRITPYMDDLTVQFALHGVNAMQLGTGPHTDLLAMSLSATDVIGHNYGPDSREMHDQVLRVDRTIGLFLDSLYALRDSTTITIVVTADHGVGSIPEIAPASVEPRPRRVSLDDVMPATVARLRASKLDTFAIELDGQILLANRRAFRKPSDLEAIVNAFAEDARKVPGVARVDRFPALLADTLTDEIARRWAHQFAATLPIELVMTLTPYSTWGGNVASHGSPRDYDSHVPLIFAGAGIRPGTHTQFVRTVDLAPTLAELLGLTPSEPLDGVSLKDALLTPRCATCRE